MLIAHSVHVYILALSCPICFVFIMTDEVLGRPQRPAKSLDNVRFRPTWMGEKAEKEIN